MDDQGKLYRPGNPQAQGRVSMTVEVTIGQPWGAKAPIGDVWEQAARDAVDRLRHALQSYPDIRILSEPSVTAILQAAGAMMKRAWVNQPSTLQPMHAHHGLLVLAPRDPPEGRTARSTRGRGTSSA